MRPLSRDRWMMPGRWGSNGNNGNSEIDQWAGKGYTVGLVKV